MCFSLVHLLLLTSLTGAVTVYQPNETYAVHHIDKEIVDTSRTYMDQPYRIMTTTFYPIDIASHCIPYDQPYMSALTAKYNAAAYGELIGAPLPSTIFESIKLQSCNSSSRLAWIEAARRWPLTILSSGAGGTRQFYSALAEELASRGYIVITLDNPGQADIIQYPDGSYVTVTNSTLSPDAQIAANLANRVQDILLIKDLALTGTFLSSHINVDPLKVAVWGHSFGGAASAEVMSFDSTIRGGVNLDGTLYGSILNTGLARPFMLWSRGQDPNDNVTVIDPSWGAFLNHSTTKKDKLQLVLDGAEHYTFCDAPLLGELTGLSELPGTESFFGAIEGRRVLVILASYVDAFFRYAFGEGIDPVLRGPSQSFPEVDFVSGGLKGFWKRRRASEECLSRDVLEGVSVERGAE